MDSVTEVPALLSKQKRKTPAVVREWLPTPAQIRYAQLLVEPAGESDEPPTVSNLAKAAGVHKSVAYRWYKKPEFRRWLRDYIETFLQADLPSVWSVLASEARKGNVPAIKLHMERHDMDYVPTQKHTIAREMTPPEFSEEVLLEELKKFVVQNPEFIKQLMPMPMVVTVRGEEVEMSEEQERLLNKKDS